MKLLFCYLALFGLSFVSYSQNVIEDELDSNQLPAIVIKSAGKDFSVYVPDKNPDSKVQQMQEEFVGYSLGKDAEGYDEYLVIFEADGASLAATYNENGKLIRVVEKYDNVKLPRQVIFSVYKSFPGWTIVKDKFLYSQSDGDVIKKQYNLKIKKDDEVKKLVIQPNGEILAGL